MKLQKFISSSLTTKFLKTVKQVYKVERHYGSGKIHSSTSAIKFGIADLGLKNSIMASIGALLGTVGIPIPGGAVVGAEAMIQVGKHGEKLVRKAGKILNTLT